MNEILSIDIETENLSNEIGGWQNTHMFKIACVCTWDGEVSKVYADVPLEMEDGIIVKTLRELKYDLDDHFDKGGKLLGHNIASFDLPILRDSMDIYCIRKYLSEKAYIDTSRYLVKEHKERFRLQNLVECTFGDSKTMDSADAPVLWKQGEFDKVTEYCLKDSQLVYNLWKSGQEKGFVKAFSIEKEKHVNLAVAW